MSWKENINIKFIIKTGDEKEYFPLLSQENSGSVEMNAGSFEFSGVDGSLVKRNSTNGETYPLIFSFTGDDHLDVSEAFRLSARNKKPWIITHPKYGTKTVQPITIKWNDNRLNETSFSVSVKETIVRNYPNALRSKQDSIQSFGNNTNATALTAFSAAVSTVDVDDKALILKSITTINKQYSQYSVTSEDATDLENAYNKALNATNNIGENANDIQDFILIPVNRSSSVASRIEQLTMAFFEIEKDVSSFSLKEYFQCMAGSIISAMCLASINPNANDYSKRKDIDSITNKIDAFYNLYITKLGDLEDENLSIIGAFNPDPLLLSALEKTVNEALANLNEVIFGALVENIYQVPVDTNIILLTHLLLGRVTDENIDELISLNDFVRDQLIQVKKGDEIIYLT